MSLLEEIKIIFTMFKTSSSSGIRDIKALKDNCYDGIAFKDSKCYGVGIRFEGDLVVNESFVNVSYRTEELQFAGNKYLLLTSSNYQYKNEFATICAQFLDPGKDGEDRQKIIQDPFDWWKNWSNLLGNIFSHSRVYDVLGEMIAFEYLYNSNKDVKWTAEDKNSHDLETKNHSYEVKSTVLKYANEIEISSQNQLAILENKTLDLMYIKFEKSQEGITIDEMADKLVQMGYDKIELEKHLSCLGYPVGTLERMNDRYKVIDKTMYPVDEDFPKIINDNFIGGALPDNISKIKYTVQLNGLKCRKW